MSLNALEKITDKILSEAQQKADRILAEAKEASDQIAAEYHARAEEKREKLSADAEREAMDHVARAKASVANYKRNLLLQTKSDLIDGVFDSALEGTRNLSPENYTELLVGLLSAAMLEQMDTEASSQALDGEECVIPEAYEVLMNQRDREKYGALVIEGVRKKLGGKLSSEKLARLTLADKTVSIDGGLILRCGAVESNCSFALLFALLREELEAEVSRALFEARGQA